MLRGDMVWAQGYSEPEAGSDLPSLRTTARRDGDEYVVNGQKVWTSHAGDADVFFALVRTGTRESRQKGITYLVIDAHAPGVQVRPLRDLTGGHLFAEVFFDDVRVPAADRIGEENGGWPLARTSLGHERAAGALNQAAMYRRVLTELEELARERGQLADPLVRDRLVDLEIRVRIIRYNAQRTIGDILAKGEAGRRLVGLATADHRVRAGHPRVRGRYARPGGPARQDRAAGGSAIPVAARLPADPGLHHRRGNQGNPAQHRRRAGSRAAP